MTQHTEWILSRSDEMYDGETFDTKEEAIAEAGKSLGLEDGERFYVGKFSTPSLDRMKEFTFFDKDEAIEVIQDEFCEGYDEWLTDMTYEEEKELNGLIVEFLFKKHRPGFYEFIEGEDMIYNKPKV